ncbi:MAG: LacI family DNA-binding transcriptional regulator [Jatrophihabitans sp.]
MLEKSTIYQVARRSGVSTATVSRVMRDGIGFSEPTRQRVLESAAELGWLPNGSARGLAERRVGIVGLLFPDLGKDAEAESESPLFVDQVIRGAERAATLAGDAVLIAATEGATGRELARSVASKVDGLVVTARSLSSRDLAAIARSVPVVLIAAQAGRPKLDAVSADNHGGSRSVTEHLLQVHGYRELAFVAGPARSPDSMQRFDGFRAALAAAGLPVPAAPDAYGGFTEAGGERALREILDRPGRPPQAVVFGNDEMAIGALPVFAEHKLRIPADVAVTGFDDIASARHVRPGLTTVRQPMRQLGEQAVRMLLDRLREPQGSRQTLVLPTQLQLRRSCGCRASTSTSRRPR